MQEKSGKTMIAICDDQPIAIDLLKDHVTSALREMGIVGWRLVAFNSPIALLKHIESIDILFLDIEMPDMDGIEAGAKIQEKNPDCKIIMATSRVDRFKEAFHINAIRFITKPFDRGEIKEALSACLKMTLGENTIDVFQNRISHKVKEKNITYIRAFNGYVELFTANQTFRKDISLDELEKDLDPKIFFRIHRQYIINMQHITTYDNKSVEIGDTTIPVSRRRYSDFVKAFMDLDLG